MPEIETLVQDIYSLLDGDNHHECNEEFLEVAAAQFKAALRRKFSLQERRGSLRFSSLGKPDCQLWFDVNQPEEAEAITPEMQLKFLYGDILEVLLLYLAKEAGHDVSDEQAEVEHDGVLGHIDAVIDGQVVDVKSASPFAFQKFKDNRVEDDDPFGYIAQLSGYCNVLNKPGGFLAIDKVSGEICYSPLKSELILRNPPGAAIERQRENTKVDNFRRCFTAVPDGKSGNEKLNLNCSYCKYKKKCWPGLRMFLYSGKPRFLTKVVREPDVFEMENF